MDRRALTNQLFPTHYERFHLDYYEGLALALLFKHLNPEGRLMGDPCALLGHDDAYDRALVRCLPRLIRRGLLHEGDGHLNFTPLLTELAKLPLPEPVRVRAPKPRGEAFWDQLEAELRAGASFSKTSFSHGIDYWVLRRKMRPRGVEPQPPKGRALPPQH